MNNPTPPANSSISTERALYQGAVASLCALILLGLAWELWLAPLRPGGSFLALKVIPLLLPLRGLLRRDVYTLQWSSMLILIYFTEGIVRATSDPGPSAILGWVEVMLALVYFICAIFYVRPYKIRAKKMTQKIGCQNRKHVNITRPLPSACIATIRTIVLATVALNAIELPDSDSIAATTYRCEIGNTVSYSDKPCLTGKERSVNIDPANPTATDRAAAIQRAKAEKAQLKEIEAEYENERKQVAAAQKRSRQEKQAQLRRCAKLELKIRREREDLRSSTGKSADKQRTQLRRAEEDYALDCKG